MVSRPGRLHLLQPSIKANSFFMQLFQQLGAEIEKLWLAQNYNEELLPAIAKDALKRADLPSKLSAWDVVEWSLKQKELPRQRDPR